MKQALVRRQAVPVGVAALDDAVAGCVAEDDLAAEAEHELAVRGAVLLADKRLQPPVQDAGAAAAADRATPRAER